MNKKNQYVVNGKISDRFGATADGEVAVYSKDKLIKQGILVGSDQAEMFIQLSRACGVANKRGCKPAEALRIFKKYVPKLIALYDLAVNGQRGAMKIANRAIESTTERSGKKWTVEEDEVLIELASRDNATPMSIATEMGRSPGAIQSRLSQLVGIGRVSQEIAGRFIGTLNGEHVAGIIDGELRKV